MNSVGYCSGGKAGRAKDGGLRREGGNSAAHYFIVANRLELSGIGVP